MTHLRSSLTRPKPNQLAPVEHGSVLVLALLVSLLLVGVGLAAMWATSLNTNVSTTTTRRQEALLAAESGVERARSILARFTDFDPILGNAGGVGCSGTAYNSDIGNVLCDAGIGMENVRLIQAGSQTAQENAVSEQITYTLYVRNDPAETTAVGLGPFNDEDLRVVVRSEGRARRGQLCCHRSDTYFGLVRRPNCNRLQPRRCNVDRI